MEFKRTFRFPSQFDAAIKACKPFGIMTKCITALGTWRSLQPIDGEYVDFEGPFAVKKGVGPAFVADDGTEVFMFNDTSRIEVVFSVEES